MSEYVKAFKVKDRDENVKRKNQNNNIFAIIFMLTFVA